MEIGAVRHSADLGVEGLIVVTYVTTMRPSTPRSAEWRTAPISIANIWIWIPYDVTTITMTDRGWEPTTRVGLVAAVSRSLGHYFPRTEFCGGRDHLDQSVL